MGKHLTFEDRVLLQHYWNVEQKSMSEIADLMGRNQSSISRELYSRNIFWLRTYMVY